MTQQQLLMSSQIPQSIQQFDAARRVVHGLLDVIGATRRAGNTTAAMEAVRWQNNNGRRFHLVAPTHLAGEQLPADVPTICLDHLLKINSIVGRSDVGFVFDNATIERVLVEVDRVMTNMSSLLDGQSVLNSMVAQHTTELQADNDMAWSEVDSLRKQVQVLTQALGDSQARFAELTAR